MKKSCNKLWKFALMLSITLFHFLPIIAAPGDHGRWYSLDDDMSSSHSRAFYVIVFIISVICAVFLIVTTLNDKQHSTQDKGCIVAFLIGLIILGVLCIL